MSPTAKGFQTLKMFLDYTLAFNDIAATRCYEITIKPPNKSFWALGEKEEVCFRAEKNFKCLDVKHLAF